MVVFEIEGRRQMHSLALLLQMLALVRGQAASSAAEAVALRAELAAVADFAVQLALVLGAVCRVERFAAKTCNTRSSAVVEGLRRFFPLGCSRWFTMVHGRVCSSAPRPSRVYR